jgi:hypothetical protein
LNSFAFSLRCDIFSDIRRAVLPLRFDISPSRRLRQLRFRSHFATPCCQRRRFSPPYFHDSFRFPPSYDFAYSLLSPLMILRQLFAASANATSFVARHIRAPFRYIDEPDIFATPAAAAAIIFSHFLFIAAC